MALLAIDYGAKKIGIAKSDDNQRMAFPLEVLAHTSQAAVAKRITEICDANQITKIIVGVPISFSKKPSTTELRPADLENKQMQEVLAFVEWLKKTIALPVELEDERLSTKLANRLNRDLIKHGPDDAVAAMLILQNYLDRQRL